MGRGMLHWTGGAGGVAAAGHLYVLYIHRSLNLDPKIFELFIQLLKCYRLLGNIRIDLGFELNGFPSRRPMRGQYPGHVTKGAGEKNISEFRTWRDLAVLSTRSRGCLSFDWNLDQLFTLLAPFSIPSYKFGKKIGTEVSSSNCYYNKKYHFFLQLIFAEKLKTLKTADIFFLYFWTDSDSPADLIRDGASLYLFK